jgi:hypothetical protein
VNEARFDLSTLELMGASARGVRLAPKPVAKLKFAEAKPATRKKKTSAKKPASRRGGGQGTLF